MAHDPHQPRHPSDRSAATRVAWSPTLRVRVWRDAHQTVAAMERGGVLLRTTTPPPLGSLVHLTLFLPDDTEVVMAGDVVKVTLADGTPAGPVGVTSPGAVVRFRVTTGVSAQLQARAWQEAHATGRPAPRSARGSQPLGPGVDPRREVADAGAPSRAKAPDAEPEPSAEPAALDETTYSIHRKPRKKP